MGLMNGPRLAAIGGGGWLGGALLRAALSAGAIDAAGTTITSRKGAVAGFEAFPGIRVTADNAAAAASADVILMAVRPQDLGAVPLDLSGKLLLSVMAMVPMAALEQRFGARRIIRSMPNAAAERGLSFTPLLASASVTDEDRRLAEVFFGASGHAEWVTTEDQLDYLTGLTGAGPAFLAKLAAAMEADAIGRGLPEGIARRAVMQLLKGAAGDLAGDRPPSEIVEIFLDYRGTTAAGLVAMEETGLARMVRAMLQAAEDRARAPAS